MDAAVRHFKAFLAIVRLGNFTRAAAELHVSQSALTVQIRQLEQALGVRLFDRNRRQVALTQTGRAMLPSIERIATEIDSVLRGSQGIAELKRGAVSIAALPSVTSGLLPRAIHRFTKRYPDISIRVHDVVAKQIINLVAAEEVDFGIGSLVGKTPGLVAQKLAVDRLCAFVPADHPLAQKQSIALTNLVQQTLVLTRRESSVRELFARALARARLTADPAYEVNYISSALAFTRAGLGIAVLPESSVGLVPERLVRCIPIKSADLTRHISILRKSGRSLTPTAEAFVQSLIKPPVAP